METNSKIETTSPTLDDLFRALGECDYLYMRTNQYLETLIEERRILIEKIENYYGQNNNDKSMVESGEL